MSKEIQKKDEKLIIMKLNLEKIHETEKENHKLITYTNESL